MTSVFLLADDLTGALDAAAEFGTESSPVQVFWHGGLPTSWAARTAVDCGTREGTEAGARATVAALVPMLAICRGMAFKKIDSLIRGHTLVELAACMTGWDRCVLAPAFPYQGRITRGGQQFAWDGQGGWRKAGPPLMAALAQLGLATQLARPGDAPRPGINVYDAETDGDLDAVVASVGGQRVLWCGTAGLARALANVDAARSAILPEPILGLFGSDQATTAAQLAACDPHWTTVADGGPGTAARVAERLEAGAALVGIDLPPGLARDDAAGRIASILTGLIGHLPRPGTLLAAGGETLRGLCLALGATSLDVQGRILPGLPRSVLRGGRWDGVTVVSKSGAFGPPHLLRDLLTANGHLQRISA